jgi:hypothetical protein
MANNLRWKNWRPGLLAALAVTFLAVLPSLQVWRTRGGAWADSDASFSGDEVAYCAYVNALLDGRPRRNDPYAGHDQTPHESLFSIQFIPPYAIAGLARLFSLTAAQAFFLLNFLLPFAAALALYWLLYGLLQDAAWAAAGAVFALCLGTYALLYGTLRTAFGWDTTYTFAYLPFMRRYVPAFAFPLFWAFIACAVKALKPDLSPPAARRLLPAACSGFLFAALVFSYFYIWTAAASWFALWAVFCWLAQPADRTRMRGPLLLILLIALTALLPYGWLVAQRAPEMDTTQLLALSRAPDFSRSSLKLGLIVCALLAWAARRGKVDGRDSRVLFAASCALAPLLMFNQQILTGRSLQPLHYEMYVAKYLVLGALFITATLLLKKRAPRGHSLLPAPYSLLLLAFGWGFVETTVATRRYLRNYPQANAVRVVARRIHEQANGPATVLYADLTDADHAPTHAPEAVLWSPHLPVFAGVTAGENRERIHQLMYFTGVTLEGVDETNYAQTDPRTRYLLHSLIEWALNEPAWTVNWQPLQPERVRREIELYRAYVRNFSHTDATRRPLSFAVMPDGATFALSNLERWYEHDPGQRLGAHTLYRLKLREPAK